jgi:hypothetical protein
MTIKGQKLVLPSWKFALADGHFQRQLDGDGGDYLAADGQQANFFFVLGVLLVSSIAGVIVHIPAGIGVLEAVFMALLAGEHMSQGLLSPPCWPTACSIILSRCCWR